MKIYTSHRILSNLKKDECSIVLIIITVIDSLIRKFSGKVYWANHPFHLHGYVFAVLGMRRLGNSTTLQAVSIDASSIIIIMRHDYMHLLDKLPNKAFISEYYELNEINYS